MNDNSVEPSHCLTDRPVLVVGGGIAGITATLEAAEAGAEVTLVEKEACIGGRVLGFHHYFPKLCPPSCGFEINIQRIQHNPRVQVRTGTRVTGASKRDDGWHVELTQEAQYVGESCTACGSCTEVCESTVTDAFNFGLSPASAIRLPHPDAWPHRYVLDRSACEDSCRACVEACQYDAIDLDAEEQLDSIDVGAVVLATGWHPYPLEKLPELGGGKFEDVVANVTMERMVSSTGPTRGKIQRPSNGEPPRRVAFVQCAGSRDVRHLPYCSAVCCLASLKQAIYVREQLPDAQVTIYYIDRRAPGRNEDLLIKVAAMEGVELVKGQVGKVSRGPDGDLVLKLEDVEAVKLREPHADLVVLATGMVSNLRGSNLPFEIELDSDGFGNDSPADGVFVAGVAKRPTDVAASTRDATGAAGKSIAAARKYHA